MSPNLRLANIFLLLVIVALAATTGCQKESTSEPTGQSAATKHVTIEVTGMTWVKGCAPRAREALATLPWAKNVQVDFDRKQASFVAETVRYDEAAIIAALEKEGFGGTVVKWSQHPYSTRSGNAAVVTSRQAPAPAEPNLPRLWCCDCVCNGLACLTRGQPAPIMGMVNHAPTTQNNRSSDGVGDSCHDAAGQHSALRLSLPWRLDQAILLQFGVGRIVLLLFNVKWCKELLPQRNIK